MLASLFQSARQSISGNGDSRYSHAHLPLSLLSVERKNVEAARDTCFRLRTYTVHAFYRCTTRCCCYSWRVKVYAYVCLSVCVCGHVCECACLWILYVWGYTHSYVCVSSVALCCSCEQPERYKNAKLRAAQVSSSVELQLAGTTSAQRRWSRTCDMVSPRASRHMARERAQLSHFEISLSLSLFLSSLSLSRFRSMYISSYREAHAQDRKIARRDEVSTVTRVASVRAVSGYVTCEANVYVYASWRLCLFLSSLTKREPKRAVARAERNWRRPARAAAARSSRTPRVSEIEPDLVPSARGGARASVGGGGSGAAAAAGGGGSGGAKKRPSRPHTLSLLSADISERERERCEGFLAFFDVFGRVSFRRRFTLRAVAWCL